MRPEYRDLIKHVRRIDPVAADYLAGEEIKHTEGGYTETDSLTSVMKWSSTPQGHHYWWIIHGELTRLPEEPGLFD